MIRINLLESVVVDVRTRLVFPSRWNLETRIGYPHDVLLRLRKAGLNDMLDDIHTNIRTPINGVLKMVVVVGCDASICDLSDAQLNARLGMLIYTLARTGKVIDRLAFRTDLTRSEYVLNYDMFKWTTPPDE